ncbi:hypothetical protein RF11_03429 [Thelohanellus kitauei]|uniref:Uncharacterized protein n=1 Tax=Thelohanellus kitauei TaxID=669202 RepID=A0A0C2MY89_THEKT|nr:hypothetical protein RF11_03429 [Thelohanellus kitauei]
MQIVIYFSSDSTQVRLVKSIINDVLKTNAASASHNVEEIKIAFLKSQDVNWLPGNRFWEEYIECLSKNPRYIWENGEKKSKTGGKTSSSPDSEMIDTEPPKRKKVRRIKRKN